MASCQQQIARRAFLRQMLLGSGMWGLRSLATGLPAAWLMQPRLALAAVQRAIEQRDAPALPPAYLILNTSAQGDPLNCNVPGTYDDPNIMHPADPSMAATDVSFGSYTGKAAQPWSTLDADTCARTAFIHHATGTGIHSAESSVLKLMDAVLGLNNAPDALSSALARTTAPALGTVQVAPLSLGAANTTEGVIFQGRPQLNITPSSLFSLLGHPKGALQNLQALRDADFAAIDEVFRSQGNTGQRRFLDNYATSQAQVRQISDDLLNQLATIVDDTANSQIAAALVLIQMKVAPIVTVHIPFGGDNHEDGALKNEVAQSVAGVATLASMAAGIGAANLSDSVTFASLNVFGRTMSNENTMDNFNGRSHNAAHHVCVLMGPYVNPGVIGGVAPSGGDYAALPFDAKSGVASADGNITQDSGLVSVGRTIGAAIGLTEAQLDAIVPAGTTIAAALK